MEIKLKDGRVVTIKEYYQMICEQFGLSGTKSIHRHPDNPDVWYEDGDEDEGEYLFVEGSEDFDGKQIMKYLQEQSDALDEVDRILGEAQVGDE